MVSDEQPVTVPVTVAPRCEFVLMDKLEAAVNYLSSGCGWPRVRSATLIFVCGGLDCWPLLPICPRHR